MKGMVEWFARNSVAANLMMFVIFGGGTFALANQIKMEVFPEFSADLITVQVPYLGAAPEEVEEGVNQRIEERLQDLDGIKELRSTAAEGIGTVSVEVRPGVDAREVLDDVKSRVDAIDTFPEETEKPISAEVTLRRQVINLAIYGEVDEGTLKRSAEQVREDLLALGSITQVEVAAVRPYEISIEVSEQALRRWGLTFNQVANAVRTASLDLPGGAIDSEDGQILLRTTGQAYRGEEFENLVLISREDGTRLVLSDVAKVVDGFAETDQKSRFDGQPAALVQVFRVGDQSALEVSQAVYDYVDEKRLSLPEGLSMTTWRDDSLVLKSRLSLLLENGIMGLTLVLIVLALFLKLRLAFWVALGIPISFMGALWLLPSMDVSINLISLFAFLVVLGIVVDDAIVVGENIFRKMEEGLTPLRAAIAGAQEVSIPVLFAILTTIAAFAPLLTVQGNTGKIMKVIPTVVIATLIFSLVESLLILPAHLAHTRPPGSGGQRRGIGGVWQRFQNGFSNALKRFVQTRYRAALGWVLSWRYAFVAAMLALLFSTVGLVAGGWIKFTFFPPVEADNVGVFITMPQGTPADVTERAVRQVEQAAVQLQEQLAEEGEPDAFRHFLASVGEQPFRTEQSQGGGGIGASFSASHLGEVTVELAPAEERVITSPEIANRWRELVGEIPDAQELVFSSSLFSTGEAINVQLSGPSLEQLEKASSVLKESLRAYPGVFDIADSFEPGKQELKLDITPEAQALGVTLADVGRQVRQAFFGEEAQRVQRGREEVKVMVRYPEEERSSLGNLESLRVRTPAGVEMPFTAAAEVSMGRGYATIQRVEQKRVINVTADVDIEKNNANEVIADLEATVLPQLRADFPGLRYSFEGEQQEQRETMGGLVQGFLFALMMIYVLLAVPFRSYLQPLIVMSAIPFGLIGAILGHFALGMNLTMLSGFGIVALTGVVVNDSLVMVDFINRKYRAGMPLHDAVRSSGEQRFRPILLTSLTTFVGLLPLLLEKSLQAQFLIPMAASLAFGVLFATVIILMLVPVAYYILEDITRIMDRVLPGRWSQQGGHEVLNREDAEEVSPNAGELAPAQ
ncbi:MAG: efflux RND transporter permease subunit [Acidobacteriota bacterium]